PLHKRFDLPASKPGPDSTNRHEIIAAIYADDQRSQHSGIGSPSTDDDFVSGTALGLEPVAVAIRRVGGVEALGHDTLHLDLTCRFQNGLSGCYKVIEIPDSVADLSRARFQQRM